MRKVIAVACLLTIVFLIAPPLITHVAMRLVNNQYPSRSLADARTEAVARSSGALSVISEPNIALSLSSDNLRPLIEETIRVAAAEADLVIDEVHIHFAEQMISFSADIGAKIPDIGAVVVGTATGGVAVASEQRLVVLLPTLDRIQVTSIDITGFRLPGTISNAIAKALNAYVGNINGRIDPIEVETPAKLFTEQDFRIGDRIIEIPDHTVIAASLLIEAERLAWLGEVGQPSELAAGDKKTATAGESEDYSAFRNSFVAKGGQLLETAGLDGIAFAPEFIESLFGDLHSSGGMVARAEASLDAAWRNAHRLAGPDVSVFLPAAELTRIVEPVVREGLQTTAADAGITLSETTLSLGDGTLSLDATGDAEFTNPVAGRASLRISVAVSPVSQGDTLSLLPSLAGIRILSAEAEGVDTTGLLTALNSTLAGLVSGLNEALPAIPINLQPVLIEEIDLAAAASRVSGLTLRPEVIPSASISVERSAILVTRRGIAILADVTTDSVSLPQREQGGHPGSRPDNVGAIEAVFMARTGMIPDGAMESQVRVALSWRRLAEVINALWSDVGGIRATYRFDTGPQRMNSTPIELVEKPTYECTMGRRCVFDSCADSCGGSCDRNCGRLDLWCEARQVECRVSREVCRVACQAVANVEKAACDLEANLEKAGCDAGRAIQAAASHVGGIGRIGGSASVSGFINTSDSILALASDRPAIHVAPAFDGSLSIQGTLSFVPYDIGHILVCPAKGRVSYSTNVTIPRQRPIVKASLTVDTEAGEGQKSDALALVARVHSFEIKARLSPAPAEAILTQNPHLLVVCNPVLGPSIAGLAIFGKAEGLVGSDVIRSLGGSEVAAILTGDLAYESESLVFPINIESTELKIGKTTYSLLPSLGETAIWFTLE